ncbi:MAG: response regulator [Xylanivirga thermophila]|uniref:response regulator transcription factor n=1 Tax=Xylanivirga thermophila TaxID=2496273 RepID=UPI0013EC31A3|nr:response regulator [Xylanivirga thermophila]
MKILVVDDSRFSQIVISNMLKKFIEDVKIDFASDGEEGFDKYKYINPDYVFVDLLMPKMDGRELIKLIREYDDESKIFVVSADIQKSIKEEVEAYGIKGFFNKPFNEGRAEAICDIIKGDANGQR